MTALIHENEFGEIIVELVFHYSMGTANAKNCRYITSESILNCSEKIFRGKWYPDGTPASKKTLDWLNLGPCVSIYPTSRNVIAALEAIGLPHESISTILRYL